MKVLFGPAGFGAPIIEGLQKTKSLNLGAAEVEFTYGVRIDNALAKKAGELAKKLNIALSVHAPYYVNLASEKESTIKTSKNHILASCERAHHLGAPVVVFHAAYYGKHTHEACYEIVKKAMLEMQETIKKKGWDVKLAPETTGKGSQFGTVDEIIKLHKEIGSDICVDFAHILARNNGKIDFDEVLNKVKSINPLHCHFSGIAYTEKGERSHRNLEKSDFMPLAKSLKRHKTNAIIVCESPDIFGDAIKMQNWFKEL